MMTIRRAKERGHTKMDWLDSRHTFSFGQYHDPENKGFRSLRVINDDRVVPGGGFGVHGHNDMEIITVVTEGALEHQDSLGSSSVMHAGDVQVMSAGAGITHSEFNASKTEPLRFIQIWIYPEEEGGEPTYDQRSFLQEENGGKLHLIASPDERKGSLKVHQDARLYTGTLEPGEQTSYAVEPGRHIWIHVIDGALSVNGTRLEEGDGAAVSDEQSIELTAKEKASLLLFDLA